MTYKYTVDHIPKNTSNNRRPGFAMEPNTITMHTTANERSTARNERDWLTNPTNIRTASYQLVVDDKEVIECIPLIESAWHAGDGNGAGNRRSIGIEICERNYQESLANAVELVANLLYERNWDVDRLRRHWDWSKKKCPRLMYDSNRWTSWEIFKRRVQIRLDELKKPKYTNASVVYQNNKVQALLIDGKTMVQIRDLAKLMNVQIGYNNLTRVTTFNNKIVTGTVIEGRTYMHVREAAAFVGLGVAWNQETRTVTLK